jgi:hypothetical protein
MKWSRDHVLTWGYMRDLALTVDFDRLNIISSGTYYEGRNLVKTDCAQIHFTQCQNVLGQIVTKCADYGAILNFDLCTYKSRSNQKPGYYVMYPY